MCSPKSTTVYFDSAYPSPSRLTTTPAAHYHVIAMPTIAYHTLGCKVNQYETEKIREELERAGFETVPFSSRADAYVINTCSVTGVADWQVPRGRPAGAEAQPRSVRRRRRAATPSSNPARSRPSRASIWSFRHTRKLQSPSASSRTSADRKSQIPQSQILPRLRTRAVVKVQDGCDQFCSYCMVPYARSRKWSRPMDEVMAEIESLAGFGYKEIVLTGIRLGSYDGAAEGSGCRS